MQLTQLQENLVRRSEDCSKSVLTKNIESVSRPLAEYINFIYSKN